MSTDHGTADDPTSTDSFNDALRELLRSAHDSGVNVEGGWECRNGTAYPDWDVDITELVTNDDGN